ncbi:UvrD-like helicase C-terminal domain-containing protein [Proteiniborus ethanoligenes]|uniref:DNA 3'-5' helicase n=1 Tax=Proteiniborus ethanoligenes TaxID=415015 RepID=A0A1H3NZX4_9FIRM|nr:3'-5' exonuclease [Proteiniborus ethanoligenes]SDY94437.1 UvrD-like helicase C-terminal domain-containing protein [Proteiniborus ethanoligenes]
MNVDIAITKTYLTALSKLPKSKQKKANNFFEKFKLNPDSASINYEDIIDMKDDKVRTVRIDQKYRAIIIHPPEGNVYLFVYIDNHDEAMDWAKNKIFNVNSSTSAIQVVDLTIGKKEVVPSEEEIESQDKGELSIADIYTQDELISIGIPKLVLPVLSFIKTDEDLVKHVKEYVSEDIYEILSFCLEGIDIEEIKECFSIENDFVPKTMHEAINKDINKSYIKVISEEDVISKVLDDPIDLWRIFIHPQQNKYVIGNNGNYKGSFQLKGSAGTGKTVVAMHRAKYLAENVYTSREDKILFTTYSKKLTKSVEYNLKNMCNLESLNRIEVINLHSWIAKYLKEHNISFKIIDDETRAIFIESAITRVGLEQDYTLSDVITEIDVVLSYHQVMDLDSYLRVSRNGAFKKLGRSQRKEVWNIISEYLEMLHESDFTEWWIIIKDVIHMISRKKDINYSAIIIDEAQDFGMPEYRLIRALIDEKENDLFIVGDIRQRIYSVNSNFSKCGINIKGNRTRELKINYRNTLEISQQAEKIIRGVNFTDFDSDTFQDKSSKCVMRGKRPIINNFPSQYEESNYVLEEIRKIVSSGINYSEIAIVSRVNSYLSIIKDTLNKAMIRTISLEEVNPISQNNVYIGTMHGIKGFEFKVVFLVGMNESMIPYKNQLDKLEYHREIEEYENKERSLLYVAMTRARDQLYILSSNQISKWIEKIS